MKMAAAVIGATEATALAAVAALHRMALPALSHRSGRKTKRISLPKWRNLLLCVPSRLDAFQKQAKVRKTSKARAGPAVPTMEVRARRGRENGMECRWMHLGQRHCRLRRCWRGSLRSWKMIMLIIARKYSCQSVKMHPVRLGLSADVQDLRRAC